MPAKRNRNYGLKQDEKGVWHCDFSVSGQRFQRSTFTKVRAQAEEWCAALAERAWREIQLGEKPVLTWDDATARWFEDKERDGKRDIASDEDKKLLLDQYLKGRGLHEFHTTAGESQGVDLNSVLDDIQAERGITNSTRNRYRSFIIGVMNHSRDRGFQVPALKIGRRKELRREPRALTHEEAEAFIADLYKTAIHIGRPAQYSLACGARQANVTGLRWFKERYGSGGTLFPHVSEDLWTMHVPAEHAKAGKMLRLPLNPEARKVLIEARDCTIHGSPIFAFTFYGQPMSQPYNTSFIAAVARHRLQPFNWHGLRHTWTTWHLENGTPIEVVQKLGGWASIHVLLKHYSHLTARHVDRYAGNVWKREDSTAEIRRIA